MHGPHPPYHDFIHVCRTLAKTEVRVMSARLWAISGNVHIPLWWHITQLISIRLVVLRQRCDAWKRNKIASWSDHWLSWKATPRCKRLCTHLTKKIFEFTTLQESTLKPWHRMMQKRDLQIEDAAWLHNPNQNYDHGKGHTSSPKIWCKESTPNRLWKYSDSNAPNYKETPHSKISIPECDQYSWTILPISLNCRTRRTPTYYGTEYCTNKVLWLEGRVWWLQRTLIQCTLWFIVFHHLVICSCYHILVCVVFFGT